MDETAPGDRISAIPTSPRRLLLPAFLRFATALLVLGLAAAEADAAKVYVKGGKIVEGDIVKRTDLEVRVKRADGSVVILRTSEIDRIDDTPTAIPEPKDTGDAQVDAQTAKYAAMLGQDHLSTALAEFVVVRGDSPYGELKRLAEMSRKVCENFFTTLDCTVEDVLVVDRYGKSGKIEIFQFVKEDAYGGFIDKVMDKIRNETVDAQRLAFMKRQHGFWIVSPRLLMAGYTGPDDFATELSAVCHKTSHILLTQWKESGAFKPWWLYEGFAAWQEFEVIEDNRVYCLEPARPDAYNQKATAEADESQKAHSEKDWRAKVKGMIEKGTDKPFSVLGKLPLNELVFEDVQQSWSIVDWLQKAGKLQAFMRVYKDKRDLEAACKDVLELSAMSAGEAWRQWVPKNY